MALTDNCEVFASVNEAALNRVVRHVMRQRPSMFNIGTPAVVANPGLLCSEITPHPVVVQRGNPLVGPGPELPVPGTSFLVEYAAQLAAVEVDVSPNDVVSLPPELAPLGDQRLAVHARICAGLGCPPEQVLEHLPGGPAPSRDKDLVVRRLKDDRAEGEEVFDSRRLGPPSLFAVTLIRPGRYSVANAISGAHAEIVVAYPQVGEAPYRPPDPLPIESTEKGFSEKTFALSPAQGIVFRFRTESRIQIELIEPDDGKAGERQPAATFSKPPEPGRKPPADEQARA